MKKTYRKLTALLLISLVLIILLFHSFLGLVVITEEFDDQYQIFVKKQFNSQAIFYHTQGMADLDSNDVSNKNFKLILEYCEMRAYPDWRCPMDEIYQEQQRRNLTNKF